MESFRSDIWRHDLCLWFPTLYRLIEGVIGINYEMVITSCSPRTKSTKSYFIILVCTNVQYVAVCTQFGVTLKHFSSVLLLYVRTSYIRRGMGRIVNVFKKQRHLPHFPSVPPHHLQGTAVARNNPAWSEHMLGLIYIHRLQCWEHILVTGRTKLNWHLRYWAVTQAAEARADLQLPCHLCSKK